MTTTKDVYASLLSGELPPGCTIHGTVDLSGTSLSKLPDELTIDGSLIARNCKRLTVLPPGLSVKKNLDLSGCSSFWGIRDDLKVGNELTLDNCTALIALPELWAGSVSCSNCSNLSEIRKVHSRSLNLTNCTRISNLPGKMFVHSLNVTGCKRLKALPNDIRVRHLNLADSGLTDLPKSSQDASLAWRGIPVDWAIAFYPDSITTLQIVEERNVARRRVMLERYGLERFIQSVLPDVLDQDTDPGGERSLLRCRLFGDEDIVCLRVTCPSTRAAYILRVPPTVRTCRQAAAWIAGFEDVEKYDPLVET